MFRRKCLREHETLKYRLLDREERFECRSEKGFLSFSRIPARGTARGTVVLLHGVASNASRWEEYAETSELGENWDIVRLDLRGHSSSAATGRMGLKDWSEDLELILDRLAVSQCVLIGHSLGAHVAMAFALKQPERVVAMALLDPLIADALTPKAIEASSKKPLLRAMSTVSAFAHRFGLVRTLEVQDLRQMDAQARVHIARGGKDLEEFIERYSSTRNDLRYIHLSQYAQDLLEVGRKTPAAESFAMPVLVIGASSGTFTDADKMRQWTRRMSRGSYEIVQCAHWPMTECPQEVGAKIQAWIDRLDIVDEMQVRI